MSKLQKVAKHYAGLRNVVCAVLYVFGRLRELSYRETGGCGCFGAGCRGTGVFGCKERGVAGD